MHDLPHHYRVAASAGAEGSVDIRSPGLARLETAGPAEFGGPGDLWSPETLLTAAVADCFILSFRAVARAARFDWTAISCEVEGVLDRVDRKLQFVEFRQKVILDVPAGADRDKALKLLGKAEHSCLITNSMTASLAFEADVRTDA